MNQKLYILHCDALNFIEKTTPCQISLDCIFIFDALHKYIHHVMKHKEV